MRQAALPSVLVLLWILHASSTGSRPPEPSKQTGANPVGSCEEFSRALGEHLKDESVDVILATVPDPLTSGLTYAFDLQLDAIQRALAQFHYSLDRFWLPWNQGVDGGTGCDGYPGVVSGTRDDAQRIIVLLVGETPTAGVNEAQMDCTKRILSAAEETIPFDQGCDAGYRRSCLPLVARKAHLLGILGPTFSGSATSLARLSKGFDGPIRSGSATAETLRPGQNFKRTVLPDNLVMGKMLEFLESIGANTKSEVALLVESNTAYGGGLSNVANDGGSVGVHLRVPFPLHVHRLRVETTPAPIASPALPADLVLPIFQDQRSGAAAIPQFSRTTESYDERALENTLQSLERERIRFIGILATDDQDKLFLARRVRAFCPNATLFTLESSLLLTHPTEARVAKGMLVASTYPLIPMNQVWTPWQMEGKTEVRQTFENEAGEGVFNAAVVLLKGNELADYGMPFDAGMVIPPVWISVVGNGAMWPVKIFPVTTDAADAGAVFLNNTAQPEKFEPGHVSAPWALIGFFFFATGWVLFRACSFWLVCDRIRAGGEKEWHIPVLLLLFGDVPVADALLRSTTDNPHLGRWLQARRQRLMVALPTLFFVVLIGYLGVAWVALIPVRSFGNAEVTLFKVMTAATGAAIGALLFTFPACIFGGRGAPRRWGLAGVCVVALLLGAAAFVFFKHPRSAWLPDPNILLWYERTIGFSNGVTAAIPVLFLWLGIYLMVWSHVQSIVNAPLALHVEEGMPAVRFLRDSERPVLSEDLLKANRPLWPPRGLLPPAIAVLVPLLIFLRIHRAPLDGRLTECVVEVCVGFVVFGLAWSLNRVLSGAASLRHLLSFLGSSPLRARLEPFFATLPPKQFGRFQVLQPTVRMLAEFLESWKQVSGLYPFKTLEKSSPTLQEQLTKDLQRFDIWPAWGSLSFEFLRSAAYLVSRDRSRSPWATAEDKARTTLLGAYVVLVVSWALGAIRTFLLLATVLAACLWIAFVSYPQSPHRLLLVAAWLAMGICVMVGVMTFIRFERNEVLSAMSRTPAGKVSFDASSLRTIGPLLAGPVLAILVLEFPQFGVWLSEWAEPLLRTMK